MLHEIIAGWRTVMHQPILRTIAVTTLITDVSFNMIGGAILLFTSRELGFEPGILGMIFAVGGISSLLGALVAGRVTRRLGVGWTMVAGMLMMGVSALFIPAAQDATLIAAVLLVAQQLLGDGGYTVYEINQMSLRQAVAPERMLGRINASIRFIGLGAMLLGALAGGLIGEAFGLRTTLVLGACGTILAALWLALSPVRPVKTAPAPVEEVASVG
jgi:MFS family permease